MPFQKGPCGEGGRMRGFLLPLLEEASVVVLVLFLLIFGSSNFPLFSHNTKVNKKKVNNFEETDSEALAFALWMDHDLGGG